MVPIWCDADTQLTKTSSISRNQTDSCFCLSYSLVALETQLERAKRHVEQFKSMSEANENALADMNKVSDAGSSLVKCCVVEEGGAGAQSETEQGDLKLQRHFFQRPFV